MKRRRKIHTTKGIGRTLENWTEDWLVGQSLDVDGKENKEYVRAGMKWFDYGDLIGWGVSAVLVCIVAYYVVIAGGILAAIWFFSGVLNHGGDK